MGRHELLLRSQGPEDTLQAGHVVGLALEGSSLLVSLIGELGTGKTVFVKGVASALGLPVDSITSPTFVIANEYELTTGLRLVHADLYRIENRADLENAGFLDWLIPGTVTLLEWGDRIAEALPGDHLKVTISRVEGDSREMVLSAGGLVSSSVLERCRKMLPR